MGCLAAAHSFPWYVSERVKNVHWWKWKRMKRKNETKRNGKLYEKRSQIEYNLKLEYNFLKKVRSASIASVLWL